MEEVVLEVQDAVKRFGGTVALDGASLRLRAGEVHALLGENGAGKSTLLKALAGVHRLDGGHITLGGQPFEQGSTRRAREQGVAVIYQEPSLFPDLSLAENVFVGRQPPHGRPASTGRRMNRRAAELFERLGVHLRSRAARAAGLSIADQQIVEIAKALSIEARVIVMDEPTAALSAVEAERLMDVARRLRERGAAVVFVSHRLDEVFALCDRFTVMRDGATVAEAPSPSPSPDEVVRLMVGRELTELFPKARPSVGATRARGLERLTRAGVLRGRLASRVRAGEIVALAGLVGSGRSEVVRAIFGIDRYDGGRVLLHGAAAAGRAIRARRIARGVALVPEDRRQQGLFMAGQHRPQHRHHRARQAPPRAASSARATSARSPRRWARALQLKHSGLDQPVERLSGGNQQKVVLGQVARDQPEAARDRRADARHRRRHQGRGAPHAQRVRVAGHGRADDLAASCPRCSASPTACS